MTATCSQLPLYLHTCMPRSQGTAVTLLLKILLKGESSHCITLNDVFQEQFYVHKVKTEILLLFIYIYIFMIQYQKSESGNADIETKEKAVFMRLHKHSFCSQAHFILVLFISQENHGQKQNRDMEREKKIEPRRQISKSSCGGIVFSCFTFFFLLNVVCKYKGFFICKTFSC